MVEKSIDQGKADHSDRGKKYENVMITIYDAVSDLVVIPFPRRSEIQDQYIWVLGVGNDC